MPEIWKIPQPPKGWNYCPKHGSYSYTVSRFSVCPSCKVERDAANRNQSHEEK